MVMRLFLIYAVVELAVLVVLTSTIGFGWTLLVVFGSFVAGLALAGSQARHQLARLRSGAILRSGSTAGDGALVAAGTILAVVPGVATTVVGVLILSPPTRSVARPVLVWLAMRGVGRRAPMGPVAATGAGRYATGARGGSEIIDGEIVSD